MMVQFFRSNQPQPGMEPVIIIGNAPNNQAVTGITNTPVYASGGMGPFSLNQANQTATVLFEIFFGLGNDVEYFNFSSVTFNLIPDNGPWFMGAVGVNVGVGNDIYPNSPYDFFNSLPAGNNWWTIIAQGDEQLLTWYVSAPNADDASFTVKNIQMAPILAEASTPAMSMVIA